MSPAQRLGLLQTGDLIIVPGDAPPRLLPRPFVHGRMPASDDREQNSRKLLRRLIADRKVGKKE